MSNASEKRLQAITATVDYLMYDWRELKPGVSREEAAIKIGELAALGRTERWKLAVKTWQRMVRKEDHPLDHAITQWAIYTGYAAV